MAGEIIQEFGTNDDPLAKAIEELKKPAQFSKTYDPSPQRFDGTFAPIVTAVRLLIGEVGSLRDEVEELRRQLDAKE